MLLVGLCVAACGNIRAERLPAPDDLPDLAAHLACLGTGAALAVAHRGTDRRSAHPENSLAALDALAAHGTRMVEVDVAGLRDGTHVVFHDGVWDELTNGSGAVAATDWPTVQTLSLRTRDGQPTREGVPMLGAYLDAARGRVLLEIDFKTSSDYAHVVERIRAAGLSDHVVLIATSAASARKLRRLAPTMHISVPPKAFDAVAPPVLVWLGEAPRPMNAPVIARLGDASRPEGASLAVTDHALSLPPVLGDRKAFEACMAEQG